MARAGDCLAGRGAWRLATTAGTPPLLYPLCQRAAATSRLPAASTSIATTFHLLAAGPMAAIF